MPQHNSQDIGVLSGNRWGPRLRAASESCRISSDSLLSQPTWNHRNPRHPLIWSVPKNGASFPTASTATSVGCARATTQLQNALPQQNERIQLQVQCRAPYAGTASSTAAFPIRMKNSLRLDSQTVSIVYSPLQDCIPNHSFHSSPAWPGIAAGTAWFAHL